MSAVVEGAPNASGMKIGIVVTRWNDFVTERLLSGAVECVHDLGARAEDVTVIRCPGAFEIPLVLKAMADSGRYDALVALGAVIRGETAHFDYVAGEASAGIARVSYETGIACGFGVLTVDTVEQAVARTGEREENKGWEAAQTAVETATLVRRLRSG